MFLSFRARLFALSVVLIAVLLVIVGLYLDHTLRDWTEAHIQSDLKRRAHLVADALEYADPSRESETSDWIDAISSERHERITLVDAHGRVVADTELEREKFVEADNHLDRPEIRQAFDEGVGYARRFSESVDTDLLYVAVFSPPQKTVVRVSVPLDDVDEALAHLRLLLVIGGLLGLAVSVVMSSVASQLMSRHLQQLIGRARTGGQDSTISTANAESEGTIGDPSNSLGDVTQRLEETMATLSRERDRFRAVIDGMSEGVVATDSERKVTLGNRAAAELLEVETSVEARHLSELMPETIVAPLIEAADRDGKASIDFELGTSPPRCIHARTTPRPDTEGFIFVLHDVTTLRHLETMRRDFVANVSHELRNPVAVIQANAETLVDAVEESPEHARSFAQGIHRHSERLSRLVSDLLDISRIESGERQFDLQPIDVRAAIEGAAETATHGAGQDPTRVRIDVGENVCAVADGGALDQILVNLLDNALKYDPGPHPVEINARRDGDRIAVEVRDAGPGIDEEHRDRIFERFYRVDEGRSTDGGGTGLGLSIVKHLVTSMDGQLGYRPRSGGGSVFWFSLPACD